MRRKSTCAFCLGLLVASIAGAAGAQADDWPQWRGPNRDGISKEKGLLKEWPEEGPQLLWHAKELGDGYSTPSIVGDRVYLISNKGTDDEFVHALSVKNGEQIWKTKIGKVGKNEGPQYPGARSTPTVDGDLIFALGSNGDLACLSLEGNIVWQKNLREEFGGKPGSWAYSESPLVDGDAVVVTPGGSEATIVALQKSNGDLIWKCPTPESDEAAYSSIVIVEAAGKKQYVQFLQKGLVGVDAKTGKFLWRYEKTAKGSPANIPTPVFKDNLIYSATGRGGGGLVKLAATGDGIEATEVYFDNRLPKDIGGSVVIDGHLYGTSAGLMCVNVDTGDVKWQERGIGAASIVYADGRLYLHGENGQVALVEATPEAYRELGRFTPPEQVDRSGRTKAWAYPALANGRLYIHDAGQLWCYDVKADSSVKTAARETDDEATKSDWKQLFNGRNLDGWEHVGPGRFVVEDGVMKTEGGMGLLWFSREKFGNCTIRVVYKQLKQGSNSGVYIRIADKPDDPWFAVHNGYEVQIAGGSNPYRMTGSIYSFGKAEAKPSKGPGEWNTLEITLDGDLVKTAINGTPVTNFDPSQTPPPRENTKEFDDPHLGPRPQSGYIGLQNHDDNSVVHFKEVAVRPLAGEKSTAK